MNQKIILQYTRAVKRVKKLLVIHGEKFSTLHCNVQVMFVILSLQRYIVSLHYIHRVSIVRLCIIHCDSETPREYGFKVLFLPNDIGKLCFSNLYVAISSYIFTSLQAFTIISLIGMYVLFIQCFRQ